MLTIYKASAGSGKTYTLAYEYIKLLLGIREKDSTGTPRYILNPADGRLHRSNRHVHILAITFTNAATAEMKDRIIKRLWELATNIYSSPYAESLTQLYQCTKEELCATAAKALNELLEDYTSFNVSTIDSFFQVVLRSFAREIDHQGDYALTLDSTETIASALSELIDDLNYGTSSGRNKRLARWVRNKMKAKASEGRSSLIFENSGIVDLAKMVSGYLDEEYHHHRHSIHQFFQNVDAVDKYLSELKKQEGHHQSETAVAGLRNYLGRFGLTYDDAFASAFAGRLKKFDEEANIFFNKINDFWETKGYQATLEDDFSKLFTKATTKTLEKAGVEMSMIEGLLKECFIAWQTDATNKALVTIISEALVNLEFVVIAENYLERYLKENNLLLISETGDLLSKIISDAEMPFIYERLGMRLQNLLIDEFQDTSRMQWDNLNPLVSNAVSAGFESLIIGDVKQAIYRFRNSEPKLLGAEVESKYYPNNHNLRGFLPCDNTNHRSAGDIVRFNNTIFSRILDEEDINSAYESVVQTPEKSLLNQEAYIKVVKQESTSSAIPESVLEEMCCDIIRQHNNGYRWDDILILVRRRVEGAQVVNYILKKHPEITISSGEALLLDNSSAVKLIMGMLRLVERSFERLDAEVDATEQQLQKVDFRDRTERFTALFEYYYSKNSTDASEALRRAIDLNVYNQDIAQEVADIRKQNPANVVAIIEVIVSQKLSEEQRTQENAYITALQDLALEHCQSPDPSLKAFIDSYDRNSHIWAIPAGKDHNAVNVMTIHKSKGLEKPCVHIPVANWLIEDASKETMWLTPPAINGLKLPADVKIRVGLRNSVLRSEYSPYKDLVEDVNKYLTGQHIDNINLAYVAFTRASRELVVYLCDKPVAKTSKGKPSVKISSLVSDAIEASVNVDESLRNTPQDTWQMNMSGLFQQREDPSESSSSPVMCLEIGAPTSPAAPPQLEEFTPGAKYEVVLRDEIREKMVVDDVLVSHDDIGDEENPDYVDTHTKPYTNAAMEQAARYGTILHSILGSMRTLEDMPKALNRQCAMFIVEAQEREKISQELQTAFEAAPQYVRDWFAPGLRVYAECAIYKPSTDGDEEGFTYRPDRVVEMPDGSMAVIDYKFTTEVEQRHVKQVKNYIDLLKYIENKEISGFLWYPLLQQIRKV